MGSKRVGLARTQALLQNLKRELSLTTDTSINVGAISAGGQCTLTTMSATAGDDLADDTAVVNFVRADHGKVFLCLLDGAAKTLNLPTDMVLADVGTKITVVQGVALVNSGVLTINANTGNTFTANSYIIGRNGGVGAVDRPADANNRLVITGAASNSAWGAGSRITMTCVGAGEWFLEAEVVPLGTGNAAFAFSTV
tara:strand:- start:1064 stop:1654 length:591 start_codon:yes stop_codon:yes gene_type:complete